MNAHKGLFPPISWRICLTMPPTLCARHHCQASMKALSRRVIFLRANQTMRFWRFFPGDTNLVTPTTGGARSQLIALPHPNDLQTDLFCTGHATLPDGRMLMVGGGWIPLSPCREVYTLDPAWRPGVASPAFPWTASAQMAVQRWYATATPLPDGGILASAGTMSSGMVAFGGLARMHGADTTWRG